MKALLVDDSKTMRSMLRRIMVEAGFETCEAGDGQEALNVIGSSDDLPDVALVDWNMPVMDGLQFVSAVRNNPELRRITLVMVTTESEQSQIVRALAAGAHEYLIKPFTFAGFRSKLEQYVRYREQMAASNTLGQSDVDAMLATLRPTLSSADLPKGLTMTTLTRVSATVRDAEHPMSASELAELIGASRVTARRYLEHLADSGLLERDTRFGRTGRPKVEYRWRESRRS